MPKIAPILALLDRAHQGLLSACSEIPPARWKTPPPRGGWSASEVLAHLTMVEGAVWNGAREALAQKPGRHPLRKRLHIPPVVSQWRLVKRNSPIPLDGALVLSRDESLEGFTAARNRTIQFIAEVGSRDLRPFRRQHPFFGSLDLYDWLRVLAYHEIRHTKQLREIGKNFQS
ncbi:MAG TPA: DinB family protein [Candidatus Binatia bacterium]|nr:DinB family protein [Candidatus Binatia bacterium]